MTDIRKGVENDRRCFRERASTMGGTPETPCHDAVLELYEKLDTLSKSEQARSSREQAAARYLRERGKHATAEGAVAKLISGVYQQSKPEHEPCVCGGRPVLGYCYPGQSEFQAGCGAKCGWCGAEGETDAEAWENWDRVMRAAREK